MASLDTLKARLESLKQARASGITSYEFQSGNGVSRRLQYKSDSEMAAAIRALETEIENAAGFVKPTPSFIHIRASKGV